MNTLAAPIIIFLAAVVQGATGFGMGLVAMSLLPWYIDLKDASVVLVFSSLTLNLTMGWRLFKHFQWENVGPVFVGVLLGVPLGVMVLVRADITLLRLALGALLLASATYSLAPALAKRRWHPLWTGLPCGLLSGALSGAFGTGGPPVVAYVSSQKLDRLRYAVTLQALLATGNVVRIASLAAARQFTPTLTVLGLMGAAFAALGAVVGMALLKRMTDKCLRYVVAVLLLLLGFKFIWDALISFHAS